MNPSPVKQLLAAATVGARCCAAGWIRTRRDSKGGFSFLELNDGSCLSNLQVIADASLSNYDRDIRRLHPGSAVRVRGVLSASPGQGQAVELKAEAIEVCGACDVAAYPLQKQRISFERLREVAHLRPRTNTFGAVARVRSALSFATHRFFQERGFHYVHTPVITTNDCEGAGEMFHVTTIDPASPPMNDAGAVDYAADFFGRPASLTVSGQLEAETYACALSKVYTFGPTFRAENSNTARHLAEFWMIEPEIAFANLDDDARLAEDYVKYLISDVLDRCGEDLRFFHRRIAPGLIDRLKHIVGEPFRRVEYNDAIEILAAADVDFAFEPHWGCDLQTEHERYLTEKYADGPVIVLNFPRAIKPFYMRVNDDRRTVAAMDVLLPGIGEIIGGSQREERLEMLRERMRELDLSETDYWWYLDLRRFGTVPHAGFGLGFERMVQFCTGMANIRDVIPFPRTPRHADF